MNHLKKVFAPGARIVVRDAEWLIRRVDRTSTGGQKLTVVGISELVRDKESIFLTEVDKSIEVLDPVDTKLVRDTSSNYQASILYMESLLRQTPPTDENLYIGHKAAIDVVPYQLDPAIQALKQPRYRILMADAVGLGKTIEAGILLSELIRRGRGKRILVLAVKSMLTQFQKELWSRFAIPLVRLDSIGIQRLRSRIPTNHNPFYYYDKAIISIDTLKQDAEYRTYLENAYWDIIVVDEAHNVAERGNEFSLRSRLAKLLARRSDTLIMLSATPHDGKARSFASLMNMLDPTAIANPDDYGPDDIKGLFIRRFKKDIQGQVEIAFKERKIFTVRCRTTPKEEHVYNTFVDTEFVKLDKRRGAVGLFKTTLQKSLFSSPAACLETISNRVKTIKKREDDDYDDDINSLEELARVIGLITPGDFSKYQYLLEFIQSREPGFNWTGKHKNDRLVIFTERIESLKFLQKNLIKDLGLKEKQVEILYGTMSDIEQQRVVEDFGREDAGVRLLIASDVASEGINLHYLCHKMIHFDIPWSLMVFQQRNGRIDRYGQERSPQIAYLVTESENKKIKGDTRILELLIEKEDQAVKNIGDPSAIMGAYDIEQEEKITARAIEQGQSVDDFEASLKEKTFDPLALLMGEDQTPNGESAKAKTRSTPSLFEDDYSYLKTALSHSQFESLQYKFYPEEKYIELTVSESLKHRLYNFLPSEIWPQDGTFFLSADQNTIKKEIKYCRKNENAWPRIHFLWELNPVVEWVNDKVLAAFGRHEAPILTLQGGMESEEVVFVLSCIIPNMRSHPLIHRWFGVSFRNGCYQKTEKLEELLKRTGLGRRDFPNRGDGVDIESIEKLLPEAIEHARDWMSDQRKTFEEGINEKLNEHLNALERLRKKQYSQLDTRFMDSRKSGKIVQEKKEKKRREIDQIFDEYIEWIEQTMTTEDNPYIQVVSVLTGAD